MRTCLVTIITGREMTSIMLYLMGFILCPAGRVSRFRVTDNTVLQNILQYNGKYLKLIVSSKIGRCRTGSENTEEEEIHRFYNWKTTRACLKKESIERVLFVFSSPLWWGKDTHTSIMGIPDIWHSILDRWERHSVLCKAKWGLHLGTEWTTRGCEKQALQYQKIEGVLGSHRRVIFACLNNVMGMEWTEICYQVQIRPAFDLCEKEGCLEEPYS